MNQLVVVVCAVVIGAAGCGSRFSLPQTTSELIKGSSYLPVSPKPILISSAEKPSSTVLLDSLPNETMRISIGSIDESGALTFGAGSIGQEGHSYEVVVDYIKYTTGYLPVCFRSSEVSNKGKYLAGHGVAEVKTSLGSIRVSSDTSVDNQKAIANESSFSVDQKVPVYLGVGLRIQAHVQVIKGNVELTLFGLGSAANGGQVAGTMIIQTLGVFGAPISPLIPLPTDISQSSIQSAMQSLAAIKAKLYDQNVNIRPQVVGFETVFGSAAAIQLLEATIAGETVEAKLVDGELRPLVIGNDKRLCPVSETESVAKKE